MTTQVPFFDDFFDKYLHLNAVENDSNNFTILCGDNNGFRLLKRIYLNI